MSMGNTSRSLSSLFVLHIVVFTHQRGKPFHVCLDIVIELGKIYHLGNTATAKREDSIQPRYFDSADRLCKAAFKAMKRSPKKLKVLKLVTSAVNEAGRPAVQSSASQCEGFVSNLQ